VRAQLTIVAAASYAGLFVILVIEALRGVALFAPDAMTITQLGVWAVATIVALGSRGWAARTPRGGPDDLT